MSDIYHIPNDDGKTYRLKKFVEYQHEVPSIHYRFLGEYIKAQKISKDEALEMAFVLSSTYNEITTVLIRELKKEIPYCEIWEKYKDKLNFGSARKYAKSKDEFVGLLENFNILTRGEPYKWLKGLEVDEPKKTFIRIHNSVETIPNAGRFASDIFLETVVYLKDYFGLNVKEPTFLDWGHCANLTSGVFNIFYEDEKANLFDKTEKVSEQEKVYLTDKLKVIQAEIGKTYPEQDNEICMFIGKICSFRNLFKNARYGGFHHDRELGVIKQYEKDFPQYAGLWAECYSIRKAIFPNHLLGELNGWDGIRKERKKLWLKTGLTGVERE